MRAAIKRFDQFLREASGVFEFTDEDWCIFRLQLRAAPHDIRLCSGLFINEGEPILGLHFWNEQIPPLGRHGADVVWGAQVARLTIRSLRAIAAWVEGHPEVADRRVLGGATVLLDLETVDGPANLIRRLGFEIFPFEGPLGRFGEFWENLYAWGLMWTYNGASVRRRPLASLRRTVIWMPVDDLLARYSRSPDKERGARDVASLR
jgi:hypothetical protein